ncbi:retrovirus-related pol polyprotein from transposon TNT 1-94 [Tanacetum coccineum]
MTKNVTEHGMFSSVQQRINHKDFQNYLFACFLSQVEPKKVIQALTDLSWIEAMQDELLQFKLQKVWTLVDLPYGKRAIGTKWVYRNKKDDRGIVVRNKARLVAQGYTQEEGIDYDEVFAPIARIEAIKLFLAYASFMGFIVYQMDVKSAFLYGTIEEEVYVCQPPGFEDPQFPDKVYKVEKALYGLHQAPRAWYETLSTYLLENGFRRGIIDKTLFIKKDKDDAQEIPDEFYGRAHFLLRVTTSTPIETNKALLKDEEAEDVDVHFYRSMIGSLMYPSTPKTSHLHAVKRIFRYLKGHPKLGLWYPRDSPFDLEDFSNSDYARASLDRKSTTGGCQFLDKRLISWQYKKQIIAANSTTKAEYVAATNCCGQFWIYAKAKTVNGERQIQALVDKKKVIITEMSIRSDLKLNDAEGTDCLPTATIFAELERMGAKTTAWNEFSSTMASVIICLCHNPNFNFSKYIFDNMVKHLEGGVKFLMYLRFVRIQGGNKGNAVVTHRAVTDETRLQEKVLDLEKLKTAQAKEIASLKKRLKQLEKKRKLRTLGLKRLRKVGSTSRVESSNDVSLGDQLDASKQGRKIADLDADAEVTLVDETQEINDDNLMFDTDVLEEQEKEVAEKEVSTADPVTTTGEVVTTANVEATTANALTTTIDELALAQTLIEIKAAKPKAVTSATTTTTTTRPKARGVVVQEPSEFKTTSSPFQASQLPQAKDKGKTIMVEPERPLKKKDQVAFDEEMARNLEAQMQAELIEEERLARQKEEEANIALIESWDNTQAMMEADFKLAQRLQAEEQGEITIEERSRLFVELMNRRKMHFAKLRAEEIRRKPPTKAQKRNQMSIYLKNTIGYKHSQLKSKSYDEIQKLFDKEMKRVNTFVDMNSEVVKGSETRTEESSKRAGDELEYDKSKKQKIDEHVKAEKDNDPEEEEMKKHMGIVQDEEEIAINVIPLATKPPMIIEYKIVKEGQKGLYQLIRADRSLKRYSSMVRMLQGIDREDLETLWKLVKEKHGINRPVDEYERVLWGDMKVMFEPDIKNKVWRSLQGYKVTVWKLFDSCGVHFIRFKNLHIFMLVKKRYPLTPITISNMLNKKLQADRWNEMCYQLLKLMTKQEKGQ